MAALALVACAEERNGAKPAPTKSPTSSAAPSASDPRAAPERAPVVAPYEPGSDEEYANGKRLAGRVAQRALTYVRGATPREVADSLPPTQMRPARLARVIAPAVDSQMRSVGKVIYPQLSGVTDSSLGAMVVVRQTLLSDDGQARRLTRVLDVRLRLSRERWSLDRVASVGGTPAPRPASPSPAARRVLDDANITLSDSARWDLHRGVVDEALLTALATAAEQHELSISVFKSGHPHNVWGTVRPSAHSNGLAADIYAVDGRPVIAQRRASGDAYDVASTLFANGASQLGSPWVFGSGGPRSFTDAVHQDHLHIQQSPLS
jgi:hypothetical protein